MTTEQKLHLAAITSLVVAAILFTASWVTHVWGGLWVLSILGVFVFTVLEGWTEVHYGREAFDATHEEVEQ